MTEKDHSAETKSRGITSHMDPNETKEKGPVAVTEPVSDAESSFPRDATEEEMSSLPRIIDKVPFAAWAAALIGSAERFSYYAIISIWQNYTQHERGFHAVPGALGLGQSKATSISNGFFVFSFLTPMMFAIISDSWLGRYKTLILAFCLWICGAVTMFATSLPVALDNGAGVPGLAVSMFLIGLGVGGVKSTISPFIADQYPQRKPRVVRQKNGELAVIETSRTLQLVYNSFYWFTNIASLSAIPATFLEHEIDFWTAYLMAAISLVISLGVLLSLRNKLVKVVPQQNILPKAFRALTLAARNGFTLDHAKESYQLEHNGHHVPWDDGFIDELKRGLIAARIIFCFAFFYLCTTQMYNNLVSQASQMQLSGVPNDMLSAMASVASVVFAPPIQLLYNFLARRMIPFQPIARISTAFLICAAGMAYASGIQKLIYDSGPCYDAPLACQASEGGRRPNEVNVWLQVPVYVLLAIAEIFGMVTATQYAYEKAPMGMRGIVQATVQLSAGIGALLGMAVSPAAKDPNMVAMYAALAGVMAVCSGTFWFIFRKYDRVEDQLNRLTEGKNEQSK